MRNYLSEQKGTRRIRYIWDYYKIRILAGCALLLFICYMAVSVRRNMRDTFLCVIFANTTADIGDGSILEKKFATAAGLDESGPAVRFDADTYFSLTEGRTTGNYYYQKTVVLLDSQTADAVVCDRENLEILASRGRLLDLRDQRAGDILERYSDRIITVPRDSSGDAQPGDVPEEVPAAIDISDSRLVTEYRAYDQPCAIGLSAAAPHPDAVMEFLEYILADSEE